MADEREHEPASGGAWALVADTGLTSRGLDALRRLRERGAGVIAWRHPPIVQERFPGPDIEHYLESHGIASIPLARVLGESENGAIDDAVIAWLKAFGAKELGPDGNFRDRFRHGRLALWWWAELFLYHDTPLRILVRDVEALSRWVERQIPDELHLFGPSGALAEAARNVTRETGLAIEIHGAGSSVSSNLLKTTIRFGSAQIKLIGTGVKHLLARERRADPEPGGERRRVLFLTHASMWRGREDVETGETELVDMYFDQLPLRLSRLGDAVAMVAFGPAVPFKQRSKADALEEMLGFKADDRPYTTAGSYLSFALAMRLLGDAFGCWGLWRRFRSQPGLEAALRHRNVPLKDLALPSFRDTMLLQLPWAIRSFHEVREAIRSARPDVLVLYAEYSGLGRAAIAAAADEGVPSFAVQHGILYPRLFGAEHAPDEVGEEPDGGECAPIPTRTAVFGSLARNLLIARGNYRPEQIVVTGGPRFDALVEASERLDAAATRRRLNLEEDVKLLVLASRFSAVGPVFDDLVRAVEATAGVRLLVKPHQAELAAPYEAVARARHAERVTFASARDNLLELLFASDGLVTVDSLASSEALVLGKPVLVVNLPSNLSALVERGVALGVPRGEPMEGPLASLLFDEALAAELQKRRRDYIMEFAFGADGRSTERIVEAIRSVADERRRERREQSDENTKPDERVRPSGVERLRTGL